MDYVGRKLVIPQYSRTNYTTSCISTCSISGPCDLKSSPQLNWFPLNFVVVENFSKYSVGNNTKNLNILVAFCFGVLYVLHSCPSFFFITCLGNAFIFLFFVEKRWFDFEAGKQLHLLWKIFSGGNDAYKNFITFSLSEDLVQYHVQAILSM